MTRLLTSLEIEDILSFIRPQLGIPHETALSILELNKKNLRKQLIKCKVYDGIIPELKQTLRKTYETSMIQPGESVGVICAQAFGQNKTQSNLNSFHTAGSVDNDSTSADTKFNELLNTTKAKDSKIKTSSIYVLSENSIPAIRDTVKHSLVYLNIHKILKPDTFPTTHVKKEDEPWYDMFCSLYNSNFRKYSACVSFKFNNEILYTYKLTMKEIADAVLQEYDDIACVFSPDDIAQFDIFVNTDSISLSNNSNQYITEENKIQIYLDEVSVPKLSSIKIAGIEGINSIYYLQDLNKQWFIQTSGVNFRKLLASPIIDYTRLFTSNLWDIYENLGIEATRQFMIDQFNDIMGGVNKCHIMLLVDKMTYTGKPMSISRYTMRNSEAGPLSKCTFEEMLENFLKAGVYNQEEPTIGVSSSIICGKQSRVGSGMCNILMDMDMLSKIKN